MAIHHWGSASTDLPFLPPLLPVNAHVLQRFKEVRIQKVKTVVFHNYLLCLPLVSCVDIAEHQHIHKIQDQIVHPFCLFNLHQKSINQKPISIWAKIKKTPRLRALASSLLQRRHQCLKCHKPPTCPSKLDWVPRPNLGETDDFAIPLILLNRRVGKSERKLSPLSIHDWFKGSRDHGWFFLGSFLAWILPSG